MNGGERAIVVLWLSIAVVDSIGMIEGTLVSFLSAAVYTCLVFLFTLWFDQWQFNRRTEPKQPNQESVIPHEDVSA